MKGRSTIRGQGKLRRALRRLPKELRAEMGEVLKREGQALGDLIAAKAPRDEGDLSRAVTVKIANDKLSARVGYSPKYKRKWKKGGFTAIWQEFGTRHHPASPFIRPAFKQREPEIRQNTRKALNRMLRRARNWGN